MADMEFTVEEVEQYQRNQRPASGRMCGRAARRPDMEFSAEEANPPDMTFSEAEASPFAGVSGSASAFPAAAPARHSRLETAAHIAHPVHTIATPVGAAHATLEGLAHSAHQIGHGTATSVLPQAGVQRVGNAIHHAPGATPALRVAGGVLGPLEAALGTVQMAEGIQNGDALQTVRGGTGIVSGALTTGAAIAGPGTALAAAAPVVAALGTGMAVGHGIDESFRGRGQQERVGRGVNGGTAQVEDRRSLSDRIGDYFAADIPMNIF